jgi:hypothetical protein
MDVSLFLRVCVLSGRGLCNGLITRPEEFYQVWCVSDCDLETSKRGRPRPDLGWLRHGKRKYCKELLNLEFY